jgi:hypothetical protein
MTISILGWHRISQKRSNRLQVKAHPLFWKCYQALPSLIQQKADKQFALWLKDPSYPSLHFKKIRPGLWSARVDSNYRALARHREGLFIWFWIGNHAEYDQLLGGRK